MVVGEWEGQMYGNESLMCMVCIDLDTYSECVCMALKQHCVTTIQ